MSENKPAASSGGAAPREGEKWMASRASGVSAADQADLIRRDGWMCEQHPGHPWPECPVVKDCPGPGMPWIVAGRARILEVKAGISAEGALQQIGVMAMTAQSDPHADAAFYRKALIDICNLALKAQEAGASGVSEAGGAEADRLCVNCGRMLIGMWPSDDLRRAFVAGATWWQFHKNVATAFASERDEMEAEAEDRYQAPARPRREEDHHE